MSKLKDKNRKLKNKGKHRMPKLEKQKYLNKPLKLLNSMKADLPLKKL